ncbi:hypothetical protein Ocin01_06337 [Orchesella cincta]|uniref:Uncharacterized protein n=1 Tax=Orchesella cincta TaxID=48709 RepID=A0A1D2N4Z0_ORCCI|nr:hypothetical protein Ocin01_06337 [Orchesella cincta]
MKIAISMFHIYTAFFPAKLHWTRKREVLKELQNDFVLDVLSHKPFKWKTGSQVVTDTALGKFRVKFHMTN